MGSIPIVSTKFPQVTAFRLDLGGGRRGRRALYVPFSIRHHGPSRSLTRRGAISEYLRAIISIGGGGHACSGSLDVVAPVRTDPALLSPSLRMVLRGAEGRLVDRR